MGFDKIEAVSLTDQFVQKIESMIISGELMYGACCACRCRSCRRRGS